MITAEIIASALHGRRVGAQWMCRCPAHEDRTPSLSIRQTEDGKILVHCHAVYAQEEVINALREKGLWDRKAGRASLPQRMTFRQEGPTKVNGPNQAALAQHIWAGSKSAQGTVVERYLGNRKIILPIPDAVRLHPSLQHFASQQYMPAMVAKVEHGSDGEFLGVHRTYFGGVCFLC